MEKQINDIRFWIDMVSLNLDQLKEGLKYYEKYGTEDTDTATKMANIMTKGAKQSLVNNVDLISTKIDELIGKES